MPDFPYQKDSKGNFFPVIDLFVFNKKTAARIYALIDSGATMSVFKEDIAAQLGLNIEDGEEIYLGGVGGHIKGYVHKLEVEIAGRKFLCPVVFSREYLISFNLLGRESFFAKFKIIFEEKNRLLQLE